MVITSTWGSLPMGRLALDNNSCDFFFCLTTTSNLPFPTIYWFTPPTPFKSWHMGSIPAFGGHYQRAVTTGQQRVSLIFLLNNNIQPPPPNDFTNIIKYVMFFFVFKRKFAVNTFIYINRSNCIHVRQQSSNGLPTPFWYIMHLHLRYINIIFFFLN